MRRHDKTKLIEKLNKKLLKEDIQEFGGDNDIHTELSNCLFKFAEEFGIEPLKEYISEELVMIEDEFNRPDDQWQGEMHGY